MPILEDHPRTRKWLGSAPLEAMNGHLEGEQPDPYGGLTNPYWTYLGWSSKYDGSVEWKTLQIRVEHFRCLWNGGIFTYIKAVCKTYVRWNRGSILSGARAMFCGPQRNRMCPMSRRRFSTRQGINNLNQSSCALRISRDVTSGWFGDPSQNPTKIRVNSPLFFEGSNRWLGWVPHSWCQLWGDWNWWTWWWVHSSLTWIFGY